MIRFCPFLFLEVFWLKKQKNKKTLRQAHSVENILLILNFMKFASSNFIDAAMKSVCDETKDFSGPEDGDHWFWK